MSYAASVADFLEQQQLEHQLVSHPHTSSSLGSARAAHIPPERIAKGVLLNADGTYLLAVTRGDRQLDLNELRRQLQVSVELATSDEVESVFDDCARGAVPPMGPAYGIESVWDEELMDEPDLYFELGDHKHLVHMQTRDYLALLGNVRHGSFSEPLATGSGLWGTA